MGLAITWPRPVVLIDADPSGSNALLAGFFRGVEEVSDGLYELVLAARDGQAEAMLPLVAMPVPDMRVMVVPGIRTPEQAWTLIEFWPVLVAALRNLEDTGQDVIVDVGRLGATGSGTGLLAAADLTVLWTRSSLRSLAATRGWASVLREEFDAAVRGHRLGIGVGSGVCCFRGPTMTASFRALDWLQRRASGEPVEENRRPGRGGRRGDPVRHRSLRPVQGPVHVGRSP